MREDIFAKAKDGSILRDSQGRKIIDYQKVIGHHYNNAWFTNCHDRYRFFVGGRGSKKSQDMMGYEPIAKILCQPLRNILILRQNDADNRQTTYAKILKCINDLGLEREFKAHVNPLEVEYPRTGQKIIFRGLNDPTSLNGIDFPHGFFTDAYIDEAYDVKDPEAFRKLDLSIRGRLPEGYFYQITCCMNGWGEDSWVYQEFFKGRMEDDYEFLETHAVMERDFPDYQGMGGKGLYLHKSTFRANEFRDPNYDAGAEAMKKQSLETYQVHYLGMWGNATEKVYRGFDPDAMVWPIGSVVGSSQRGEPYHRFQSFAIGLDTGLSNGEGRRRPVLKGQDPAKRVKSATVMELVAVGDGFARVYAVDEYFHSNDPYYNATNTDDRMDADQPEMVKRVVRALLEWLARYKGQRTIMRGDVPIYVDSADSGFLDDLCLEIRRQGMRTPDLLRCRPYMSSKSVSIQERVDFEKYMYDSGGLIHSNRCPNLTREVQACRRGAKGEAREDVNDHSLNAFEYGLIPQLQDVLQFKDWKEH